MLRVRRREDQTRAEISRLLAAIAAALALAACKADDNVLRTWMGAPETRLVSVWGAPANVVQTQQGTRILTYRKERNDSDPTLAANTDLSPAAGGDPEYAGYCETIFTVIDHRIVGFDSTGGGC